MKHHDVSFNIISQINKIFMVSFSYLNECLVENFWTTFLQFRFVKFLLHGTNLCSGKSGSLCL